LLKIEVEKIKRSLKSNGIVEEIYDEGKSWFICAIKVRNT
jgi:hypothetical protein